METKTKKEPVPQKEGTNAKTENKKKDVAENKTDSKAAKDNKTSQPAKPKTKNDKTGEEFREFFIDELKDILWAEKALLKALPKMRKAATGKELAALIDAHLSETENQISTVEQVFELMGETKKGSAIRDAGLILAAQKVEHYEIATYGTLAAFAEAMQETKITKLLRSILRDEKKSDKTLTVLALESVNEDASQE